jgi:hypothetical protein
MTAGAMAATADWGRTVLKKWWLALWAVLARRVLFGQDRARRQSASAQPSSISVMRGSTRVARLAGRSQARNATSNVTDVAAASVRKSVGPTP